MRRKRSGTSTNDARRRRTPASTGAGKRCMTAILPRAARGGRPRVALPIGGGGGGVRGEGGVVGEGGSAQGGAPPADAAAGGDGGADQPPEADAAPATEDAAQGGGDAPFPSGNGNYGGPGEHPKIPLQYTDT